MHLDIWARSGVFEKRQPTRQYERTRAAVININAELRFGWVSTQDAPPANTWRPRAVSTHWARRVSRGQERIDSHKAREKLPAHSAEVERPRLRFLHFVVTHLLASVSIPTALTGLYTSRLVSHPFVRKVTKREWERQSEREHVGEEKMPRALEVKCAPMALHVGCITLYRRVTTPLTRSICRPRQASTGGARQSRHEPEVTPSPDPTSRAPPGVVKTKIGSLITGQIYHRKYRERVCARAREHTCESTNEMRRWLYPMIVQPRATIIFPVSWSRQWRPVKDEGSERMGIMQANLIKKSFSTR